MNRIDSYEDLAEQIINWIKDEHCNCLIDDLMQKFLKQFAYF